jgi:hypothetical protein
VLRVSADAVATTTALLRSVDRRESCCLWLGERDQTGGGVVRAVVVPRQRNAWGNYQVDVSAMMQVAEAFDGRGWSNLAQLHSHPGRGVEHSRYDDRMASSRRALSLVFPFYGHWTGPWPYDVGVHEFVDDYWHLLSRSDAARRVVVGDGSAPIELADFR